MPPRKQVVEEKVVPVVLPETKEKIVFIFNGGTTYTRMFQEEGWVVTFDKTKANLIQFTGGADVHPSTYGEKLHWSTAPHQTRDVLEAELFHWAEQNNKDLAGICRGGQYLTVLNGDSLWQNVDNHNCGVHTVRRLSDGKQFIVSSDHHQMMRLGPDTTGELLVSTTRSTLREGDQRVETGPHEDVEAVWYPLTRSLCFQGHPEYFERGHSCRELYFSLLEKKLGYEQ
jgi:gamma-glutamyl-gamma-aminobutyrate hydrolase PuuD